MRDTKQILLSKISELSEEATILVNRKQQLEHDILNIDVRLTQLAGAINEFDKLIKALDEDKNKKTTASETQKK